MLRISSGLFMILANFSERSSQLIYDNLRHLAIRLYSSSAIADLQSWAYFSWLLCISPGPKEGGWPRGFRFSSPRWDSDLLRRQWVFRRLHQYQLWCIFERGDRTDTVVRKPLYAVGSSYPLSVHSKPSTSHHFLSFLFLPMHGGFLYSPSSSSWDRIWVKVLFTLTTMLVLE